MAALLQRNVSYLKWKISLLENKKVARKITE